MLLAVLASMPMMLGWLILMPMVFTSLYASFCDIFPPEVEINSQIIEGEVITRDEQDHF
jgi:hypothetical protein